MNKRGQIEISFQLIFSLILIAAFIYAAMIGIKYFLATADLARINSFNAELGSKVYNSWLNDISSEYKFSMPSRIKWVCFIEPNTLTASLLNSAPKDCKSFERYISAFRDMNMFFCPYENARAVKAPINLMISCRGKDCLEFPSAPKPYCIQNINGIIKIVLEKNIGEDNVKLS